MGKDNVLELPGEELLELKERLKLEYQECVSASRSFVTIRFSFFISFMTFFGVLIGVSQYLVLNREEFGFIWPFLLCIISIFGLAVVLCARLIEERNIFLYHTCDVRAALLENRMGISAGIHGILRDRKSIGRVFGIEMTHTSGILILYYLVGTVWTCVFFGTIFFMIMS